MKSGHYQPGKHRFAFLFARNASVLLAGGESGWVGCAGFSCDEDKHLRSPLSLWLQRGAIKAAYLEMASARIPVQRGEMHCAPSLRSFLIPFPV